MHYQQLKATISEFGKRLAEQGLAADQSDRFSLDNYELLRGIKLFSALVPAEFGGYGIDYGDMSKLLRHLASFHPSTALSCSMHQHVVAANRYNHINGRPGQALLEKVAANELVLVNTGANDWLASSGELTRVDNGYCLNAIKHFASGSPAGDLLVTSAPYNDPEQGWQVLHFPVPLNTEGVNILGNWEAMGMRGTGSNSIQLKNVYIPEASITASRPRGDFHAMWAVILPVALPLIMSVYLGVAETAARTVRKQQRGNPRADSVLPYIVGEMENALTAATLAVESMVAIVDNFNYKASVETVSEIVKRKTIAVTACQQTVAKAMEACGGQAYMRNNNIESLLRDVMASHFHPMQEKRQLLFTGHLALDLEPPGQSYEA